MTDKRIEKNKQGRIELGTHREPAKSCIFCAHLIVIDK